MAGVGRIGCCLALVMTTVVITVPSVIAQEPFRLMPGARFLAGMETAFLTVAGETLIPAGGRIGSGTRVDIASGLGVEYGEGSVVLAQTEIYNKHLVNFGYLMAIPTGVKTVPHSFRFQNKTYPAGTLLETRIDFNWARCSYGYKLLELPSQWVGPRVGVHYVTCAATINGESTEDGVVSNTRRLDATFPAVGLEARYLFPYGLDLCMEIEGIHLLTRGYLGMLRVCAAWETYPNVVMTAGVFSRIVKYVEANQPLNNEWAYGLTGLTMGVMFGF